MAKRITFDNGDYSEFEPGIIPDPVETDLPVKPARKAPKPLPPLVRGPSPLAAAELLHVLIADSPSVVDRLAQYTDAQIDHYTREVAISATGGRLDEAIAYNKIVAETLKTALWLENLKRDRRR